MYTKIIVSCNHANETYADKPTRRLLNKLYEIVFYCFQSTPKPRDYCMRSENVEKLSYHDPENASGRTEKMQENREAAGEERKNESGNWR